MADLITGETSITGPNSTEFKIVDNMCSGNMVNPLSTCSVEIVFLPLSEGTKRAKLSVPSNDPDENPFYVSLMGTSARMIINAPSSLRALGVFRYSVILTWKDNSARERGFYIERSTDAGKTWTRAGQTAKNVTYYRDRFLARSTKYWYRVQAFNAAGLSQYSKVASTTTTR
jgi:hypothetical protein